MKSDVEEHLETTISEYHEFIDVLKRSINTHQKGEELSLANLIDKEFRRVKDNIGNFETQLIQEISSQKYVELALGKKAQVGNPPKEIQLFEII